MNADVLTNEQIAAWIEPNPGRGGAAHAWVLPTYASVWAVIGQLQADHGNVEAVAEAYELPVEAILAAVAYYEQHRAEIDARIAANCAFFA